MPAAVLTHDALPIVQSGLHRFAVTCGHARTEFIYCPAAVPPVLRLSETDAARMAVIRHEAAGQCGCAAALTASDTA